AARSPAPLHSGPFPLPARPNRRSSPPPPPPPVPPPPAPTPPALEAASDSGLSNGDRVTNVTAPVLDVGGVTASGNLVELLRDGVVVASRTGAGALTDPGPVPDGSHVYTARPPHTAHTVNPLSAGTTVVIDTRTPATPAALALIPADDSGTKGDGITSVKQPRLVGTLDPLTLAQLLDAGGNVVATATAAADGSFTLT